MAGTSILAGPPVAVVDMYVERHGTRGLALAYLECLYALTGETLAAQHYYRTRIADAGANALPKIELFTVDDLFGGWQQAQKTHFADGGVFDQLFTEAGRR